MLELVIQFDDARMVNSETVDVFWNVNAAGIASGAVNTTSRVNGTPIPLFPGAGLAAQWGKDAWGMGRWGGETAVPGARFTTPAVHFGLVKIAGKAKDADGNYQAGAIAEATQTVNSTPLPPSRLERGDFAGGQQEFSFVESPQLKR